MRAKFFYDMWGDQGLDGEGLRFFLTWGGGRGTGLPPFLLTLLLFNTTHDILTPFLLDCSLLNPTPDIQIPSNHPNFTCITRQ